MNLLQLHTDCAAGVSIGTRPFSVPEGEQLGENGGNLPEMSALCGHLSAKTGGMNEV